MNQTTNAHPWTKPATWTAGQVLIVLVVLALLIGGSVLAYRSYMSKTWETERNTNELIDNMRSGGG
jgi:hypothetical protein